MEGLFGDADAAAMDEDPAGDGGFVPDAEDSMLVEDEGQAGENSMTVDPDA